MEATGTTRRNSGRRTEGKVAESLNFLLLSCTSICKSQLRPCQLWCFVIQLNEDSDSDSDETARNMMMVMMVKKSKNKNQKEDPNEEEEDEKDKEEEDYEEEGEEK